MQTWQAGSRALHSTTTCLILCSKMLSRQASFVGGKMNWVWSSSSFTWLFFAPAAETKLLGNSCVGTGKLQQALKVMTRQAPGFLG